MNILRQERKITQLPGGNALRKTLNPGKPVYIDGFQRSHQAESRIMNTIMWNKRRVFILTFVAFVLYKLLEKRDERLDSQIILRNAHAKHVWEFLADFGNIKKHLVTDITDFAILSESGNYDLWKYSVKYNEILTVWPHTNCNAIGHYTVKEEGEYFVVSSVTEMCFIHGWGCSTTKADFRMKQLNKEDTLYSETIIFDCPRILSSFCNSLAKLTRDNFLAAMKQIFDK